jgi:hypothetical protein
MEHIIRQAPFLKGPLAGIRKWRTADDIRIYFRICKDCRTSRHDVRYRRCHDCERDDNLIILVDIAIRKDDTYDNLNFDDLDSTTFNTFPLDKK